MSSLDTGCRLTAFTYQSLLPGLYAQDYYVAYILHTSLTIQITSYAYSVESLHGTIFLLVAIVFDSIYSSISFQSQKIYLKCQTELALLPNSIET